MYDKLRANSALFSSSTSAEFTSSTDGIQFNYANGFNIDNGANDEYYNQTNETYVAWNWLGAGSSSSNPDGSIISTVSANVDAGFSIVSYTGTGANATVGHGLNDAPKFIITKSRDTSDNWFCYHESIGNTKYIRLDSTGTATTLSTIWNNTSPTSTTFALGTSGGANRNNDDYIAYCFAEVEGYSKFGSYTGNGSSTNGCLLYTSPSPRDKRQSRMPSSA